VQRPDPPGVDADLRSVTSPSLSERWTEEEVDEDETEADAWRILEPFLELPAPRPAFKHRMRRASLSVVIPYRAPAAAIPISDNKTSLKRHKRCADLEPSQNKVQKISATRLGRRNMSLSPSPSPSPNPDPLERCNKQAEWIRASAEESTSANKNPKEDTEQDAQNRRTSLSPETDTFDSFERGWPVRVRL
jgi:hypothetical protein